MTAVSASIKRIALSTGDGDAPGLNAVIRAAVLAARQLQIVTQAVNLLEGRRALYLGSGSKCPPRTVPPKTNAAPISARFLIMYCPSIVNP